MPIQTKTWTTNALLPAADLNNYIRDAFAAINPSAQGQGDLLVVNATADGYGYFDASANAGKFLKVTAAGTGIEGI